MSHTTAFSSRTWLRLRLVAALTGHRAFPLRTVLRTALLLLPLLGLCLLCSCGDAPSTAPPASTAGMTAAPPPERDAPMKVGLIIDSSGLGDRGFQDSIYEGAMRACRTHGAALNLAHTPADKTDTPTYLHLIQQLAAQGSDIIICSSGGMSRAMMRGAALHPQVHFALMDAMLPEYPPNVCSATFASEQSAFLAGALAARMSASRSLGVIAATRIPAVQDFVLGFTYGALHAVPGVGVHVLYIEDHDTKTLFWNNPETAAALARRLHETAGADVLFPVAGASGIGVFNYAQAHNLYAIGVDADQDYLAEGCILTSVVKRMDIGVERILDALAAGTLRNANYLFTLRDGGVDISPMRYTKRLVPTEVLTLLKRLRERIIAGTLSVPSATRHQSL